MIHRTMIIGYKKISNIERGKSHRKWIIDIRMYVYRWREWVG